MAKEIVEKEEKKEEARPAGVSRIMSGQMSIYYTNCAMLATSPKDVSVFFGRYTPTANEKGEQVLAELYERQVYMTFEQAEELAKALTKTVELIRARKNL
jgi:hypothetical protein